MAIKQNVSLAEYTTLKVGGAASWFTQVSTETELFDAITWAKEKQIPVLVLGCGSNVLIPDEGFAGLVIVNQLVGTVYQTTSDDCVVARVKAGTVWDEFVADTVQRGYWGVENLSHIPGTVGATPIQNVGAYGVEVSQVIQEVVVYDQVSQSTVTLTADACAFGYRDSIFKNGRGRHYIVLEVVFKLLTKPQPQLQYRDLVGRFDEGVPTQLDIRNAIIAIRSAKFPNWTTVGTAGSFFKNPIVDVAIITRLSEKFPDLPVYPIPHTSQAKVSLGWVLDKICGLRGHQVGSVKLSEAQALVLIAEPGANAHMISEFAADIIKTVKEKTDITIELEVTRVKN